MLILADDLSGAADCGVACVDAGLNTVVALKDISDNAGAEVLSVDADTRRMVPKAAAHEVDQLVPKYASNEELLLFKKIDSTLRGNVSVELAAALDAHHSLHAGAGSPVAILAPAFPAIGRTTMNGLQLVYGQPLHEMDIWRLQGMMGRSYIPDMLKSAGLRSALLQLDVIRSADRVLADVMTASLARMTTSVSGRVGALIACGGETARMVLQNWGVTALRLIGELERGIPVSITENWSRQLPVITKAGDFGKPEALLYCWQFLHSKDRSLHRRRDLRKDAP